MSRIVKHTPRVVIDPPDVYEAIVIGGIMDKAKLVAEIREGLAVALAHLNIENPDVSLAYARLEMEKYLALIEEAQHGYVREVN